MGRLGDFLSRLFARAPVRSEADAEQLRIAFQARYHGFRLLLDANSKALAIMVDLEQALAGERPFSLAHVRARCTRAAAQVSQMVRQLEALAPGKYAPLSERFGLIQEQMTALLGAPGEAAGDRLVVGLDEVTAADAGEVGNKFGNLGEMRNRIGLTVPDGFVVTSAGYRRFMLHDSLQEEINRRLQVTGGADPDLLYRASNEIRQLIVAAPLPAELEREIHEQFRRLEATYGEKTSVAVRSSALDEDLAGASVAGQYRSELNVRGDGLIAAYKSVLASTYGLPAMNYRFHRGLPDDDVAMCVGVLPMIPGVAGGVLYTRSPLDLADDSIMINSAWGLPMPVVEGRIPSDSFVVARGRPPRISRREVREKPLKFVCDAEEGLLRRPVADDARNRASLTDGQVLDLARIGLRLERHYGVAQDIEWAIDRDGRIVLLQTRPLRISPRAGRAPGKAPAPAAEGGTALLHGGITASAGAASGRVFIVEKEADALRFEDGAVMVTVQPLPRWAHLLGRACAVVAEQGSVASHLANVAREFGIPALFGAEDALARLATGQTVTVDADGCVVYDGRVESVLGVPDPPANPMEGSPVYDITRRVARLVTPLHLLDPDAADFRAECCSTLHDITRFCHEKAVQEMFRFGKEHRFPERSSKQLFENVPMHWWVLNLDDGFTDEVQGRYVRLDQIASRPMLDVWDGITAVPWEGPPPLDGKGFLSVMFGATTNKDLTTGVRSSYVERNYFMISANYCSLQTRLGAHFAIIEALVSARTTDNYVSYQFKGGAADFERRSRRVALIKEILEEQGFRVVLNEDNLVARLEGREAKYMSSRLRILGYLTIHTRQLDMVMSRPASVKHYRAKLRREIENM